MTGFELVKLLSHRGALDQEIYIGTRTGDVLSRLDEDDVALIFSDEIREGDVVMILV